MLNNLDTYDEISLILLNLKKRWPYKGGSGRETVLCTFLTRRLHNMIIIVAVTQGKRARSEYTADFLCILQVEIAAPKHTSTYRYHNR